MNRNDEIKQLAAQGIRYAEISAKFNISRQRVHQIATGYKQIPRRFKNKAILLQKICTDCGLIKAEHIHHKDENPSNNSDSNLIPLCKECHYKAHGKISARVYPKALVVKLLKNRFSSEVAKILGLSDGQFHRLKKKYNLLWPN
jgi:5-methylcytosine-specific restriction endonuclease McrA